MAVSKKAPIDWTVDQGATDINTGNYTDTTYAVGDGGLTQNNFTNTLKTKVDGIETAATADQTNAEIKTAYEANADTNEFSDAEQSKLAGIEASATADQTNAEIKTAYEANSDTNEFSDAEQTKLSGIETAATADQTNAQIKTAYEANADTNEFSDAEQTKLSGIETSATADQTNAEIKTAVQAATSISLGGSPTTTTQAESDDSTKIATTAYVTDKITTLIGGAPSTLNDLNELASAINDDANYNTTLTTALGTKLPKAGGAMTGAITTNSTFDGRDVATDGTKLDGIATSADVSSSALTAFPTGTDATGSDYIPVYDTSAGQWEKQTITNAALQGPTGATGATGNTGAAGSNGDDGATGATGSQGATGNTGAAGSNGTDGDDGATGATGNTGATGSQGAAGAAGSTGATGATGADGADGADGALNALPLAGGTLTGNLSLGDNVKAQFGAGNDLEIYHDGGNTYIKENGTGDLRIKASNLSLQDSSGYDYIACSDLGNAGEVEIKYAGVTKLKTTSTGIDVTGSVTCDGLTSDTGNSGTFTTSDTNSYPRITTAESNAQLGLFRSGSSVGGGYLGGNSDACLMVMNGSFSEKMRIDSSGNVGIGTSSPGDTLEISKVSSNHGIKLTRTGTSSGSASLQVQSGGKLALTSGSDFAINTPSATDALVVKATTGNVGIGTTSPGNKLTLPNAQYISWKDPAGTGENCWLGQDSSGDFNINIGQSGGSLLLKTANTERLRIDSSGNVGVGTSSPSSYNSNGQSLVVAGTGNTGITVSSGTASKSSIMFADGTGGTAAYRGSLKYDHSSDDMILSTATAERMRIDSSGNVGIGTTSPSSKLEVSGQIAAVDATDSSIIAKVSNISGVRDAYLKFNDGSGTEGHIRYNHYNKFLDINNTETGGWLTLSTENAERMRIDSAGNMGIGTSSPSAKLQVESNASEVNSVKFHNTSATGYGMYSKGGSGSRYIMKIADKDSNSKFIIDGSGNVGIGTTSPSGQLHIKNTSGTGGFTLTRTTAETTPTINISTDSTKTVIANWGAGLAFSTAATSGTPSQRMIIDSSGNVGIGTTSPSSKLDVAGNVNVTGSVTCDSVASSGALTLGENAVTHGIINSADTLYFNCDSNNSGSSSKFIFGTDRSGFAGGSERMRIDSSGDVLIGQTSQTGYTFAQKLVVGDGDDNDGITIQSGATHQGNLAFNHSSGTTAYGRISYQHQTNYMQFFVNNSERMRIDSSGNVGIGTSSPSEKLDVNGNSKFKGITETQTTSSGTTYTVDLSLGTIFNLTSASTCTVTMPSATAGKSFTVIAAVPSAWSGTIKWSGGSAPTGTGICIYTFVSNGTDWYGMEAGNAFA